MKRRAETDANLPVHILKMRRTDNSSKEAFVASLWNSKGAIHVMRREGLGCNGIGSSRNEWNNAAKRGRTGRRMQVLQVLSKQN